MSERGRTGRGLPALMAGIGVSLALSAAMVGPAAAAKADGADEGATYRIIVREQTAPGEAPRFDVVETDVAGIVDLLADPGVKGIELDGEGRLTWVPTDPDYEDQWEHQVTGMETAWDTTRGSAEIVIAVVDSGVNPGPEFAGRLLAGESFIGADPLVDPLGHGTSAAGVAAAAADNGTGGAGVCSECTILPVQVAQPNGNVSWSAAATGIVWAVDEGADILNLSFGGASASPALRDAIAYAVDSDVIVVASAGNEGTDELIYPGAFDGVVAVAAHDETFARYEWSSYGQWADVAAPGCVTSVTSSGSGVVCGTSFASPWTAGAAALLLTEFGPTPPASIEAALEATTSDLAWVETGAIDASTLFSQGSPPPPAPQFTDVDPDAYYADAVDWMVAEGITTGTSATTFSPDDDVTRGQVATFLWRHAGEPTGADPAGFADTDPNAYYADAVDWMVTEGITTGTSPTTFSPDDDVTRGQVATFLWRYAGSPATSPTSTFDDVDPAAYYADAVDYLVAEGITTGTSPTTFSPDDDVTRAQLATFLWRFAGSPIV